MNLFIALADSTATAVADTVVAVQTTLPVDVQVQIYEKLLESQQGTYEMFIWILLSLFAILVGYNIFVSKREIKKHTERLFNDQKEGIVERIKEEYERELYAMQGESARTSAVTYSADASASARVLEVFKWYIAAENFQMGNYDFELNDSLNKLIECLHEAINQKVDFNKALRQSDFYKDEQPTYHDMNEFIDELPVLLDDKKKTIKDLLKELEGAGIEGSEADEERQ